MGLPSCNNPKNNSKSLKDVSKNSKAALLQKKQNKKALGKAFLSLLSLLLSLSLHTALPSWPGQARLSNHQYFYSHALPCIFKGLLTVLENYSNILILASEASYVNFLKKS